MAMAGAFACVLAAAPVLAQRPPQGETPPRTEAKPPVKPPAKPESKPAAKPGTKPDAKPDPKTVAKPETKPAEPPFDPLGKVAVLQGLDKVTARTSLFEGNVGGTVKFGSLEIVIRRCEKSRPDQKPERAAFIEVYEATPGAGDKQRKFSGWMFASNPAVSALEHPVYDVWIKDCK